MLHEIGHTLGVAHSSLPTAIMFPHSVHDRESVELSEDDINAIQTLYGPSLPKPLSTTTTTQRSEAVQSIRRIPNLCEIKHKVQKVLVLNKYLYVFYDRWVWIIPLEKKLIPSPVRISMFLPIPNVSFKNDGYLYQKANRDIHLIYKREHMIVDPDSFRIKSSQYLDHFGLPEYSRVNGAVNTYTRRTFIFFNNTICIEMDEVTRQPKSTKFIHETFRGIPPSIDYVFRYVDGIIYFIKDQHVYSYDEFQDKLVKEEKFSLEKTLGIPCQSEEILAHLKNLLSMIINHQIILPPEDV
ncbi:hypothetical protein HHI36_023977 [Cryptolaemus montrouzieri]|uniref:Peptidase M10 metallopeptidase domain-containing protein n=1 Tax=Cryptolaemus montrouzieri TaxID=559131 RepID=A0ABD2NJ94_9CUCU